MKVKPTHIIIFILVLSIGFGSGIVIQKYYGVENILKKNGVKHGLNSDSKTTQLSESSIPENFHGKLQLFILAGQSNMTGITNEDNESPRLYVFGSDYNWKVAIESFDLSNSYGGKELADISVGFGPAIPFATSLLNEYPNMVIGLIPCEKGSSSIYYWRRNLNETTLYGSCLKRVRKASEMGDIAGILFFQGETDA